MIISLEIQASISIITRISVISTISSSIIITIIINNAIKWQTMRHTGDKIIIIIIDIDVAIICRNRTLFSKTFLPCTATLC